MKKKITIVLSLMIVFVLGMNQIKADDHSGGSVGGNGGGTGNYNYKNGRVPFSKGYRVSIVRYKSGVDSQPVLVNPKYSKNFLANDIKWSLPYSGRTVKYIETPVPKTSELNPDGTKKTLSWATYSTDSKIPAYEYGPFVFNGTDGGDDYDYSAVKNYFDDLAQPSKTAELKYYLKNTMGFELEDLEDCQDIRYYYILVEPTLAITYNGVYYYGTVSELSTIWVIGGMSKYLFTPDTSSFHITENGTNVNIPFWYDGIGYNPSPTTNILARNGYGVGTLWIGGFSSSCKKCYKKSTTNTSGNLVCTNTDQNNVSEYTEKYEEINCSNVTKEDEANTKDGKLIKKTENCNIYCTESALASFPGSVSQKQLIDDNNIHGTYFAWPTKSKNSKYSMLMRTTYTCKIVNNSGKTCTEKDKQVLKKAASDKVDKIDHSASLEAGNNLKIDSALEVSEKENTSKENNDTVTYSKITYFKIKEGTNQYVNLANGNVLQTAPTKNFFNRKEGVVSLSNKTDETKIYDLILKNIKLGAFTDLANKNVYKCNYSVYRETDTSCECPPDTYRAGESLEDELALTGKSCAELQATVCNTKYCITPQGEKKDITNCIKNNMNSGMNYDDAYDKCYETECVKKTTGEYCLDKNNNPIIKNGQKVVLTTCINERQQKGYTYEESYKFCFKEKCSMCIDKTGKQKDLTDCMQKYHSYDYCEYKECSGTPCPGGECTYTCKDVPQYSCNWILSRDYTSSKNGGTSISFIRKCVEKDAGIDDVCGSLNLQCPGGNSNMKDPTNCLMKQLKINSLKDIATGLNNGKLKTSDVQNAFAACRETVCPTSGKKIIYRTIDLNNPFPGKNNNGNLQQFSNSGLSRKPGANWNSVTYVKNEILNGRGVSGYDLYKKEPLMTITLTPDTIKKIKEYNKNNKYDDFNLEKVKNASEKQSGYYTSLFIRKEIVDNVKFSDNCKNINTVETFNKCFNNN